MTEMKGIMRSKMFCIDHLDLTNDKDQPAINMFRITAPEGRGLEEYLKSNARYEESKRIMRTYLVREIESDAVIRRHSFTGILLRTDSNRLECR